MSRGGHTASESSLAGFLSPQSIVLVGAKGRSIWTTSAISNLTRFGFGGPIYLVNPRGGTLGDREIYKSCRDLPGPAEMALLMVPGKAIEAALDDLANCGTKYAVILSSGFAELGEEGATHQARITSKASQLGIRLLGPNCLGFVNYSDKVALWTVPVRRQKSPGTISVLTQSGSVGDEIASFCHRMNVQLDILASTGNEADLELSEILTALLDRPTTSLVAIFAESIRDTDRLAQAAARAKSMGKPILILKNGSSETASKIAQSHTGSLVGDDLIFDAACHKLGMVRVKSIEELVLTADLLDKLPAPSATGIGLAAISGGICGIAADVGAQLGKHFPAVSLAKNSPMLDRMPSYWSAQNPMDITGAALLDFAIVDDAMTMLANEDEVGVLSFVIDAPARKRGNEARIQFFNRVGRVARDIGKPTVIISNTFSPPTSEGSEIAADAGVHYLGAGVSAGLGALSNYLAYHASREADTPVQTVQPTVPDGRPITERETLEWLAKFGVPTIPSAECSSAEEAVEVARALGKPLAMKIMSPDIQHKTEVGGVKLNVEGDGVAGAFQELMNSIAEKAPTARIDGVSISPMRNGGIEILVGVSRDPQWGIAVTVGLGGIWVEALKDTSTRLAPVDNATAQTMIDELRGKALLEGFRGSPPVSISAIANAIVRISEAAMALGPQLESLEVNPLLATEHGVEALDALTVWNTAA